MSKSSQSKNISESSMPESIHDASENISIDEDPTKLTEHQRGNETNIGSTKYDPIDNKNTANNDNIEMETINKMDDTTKNRGSQDVAAGMRNENKASNKESISKTQLSNKVGQKHQSTRFNVYPFLAFCLLLAPLIMGFHISAFFNDNTIRSYFSVKMGYSNTQDSIAIRTEKFPAYLMSLGCTYPLGGMVGALTANNLVDLKGRKISTYIYIGAVIVGSIFKFTAYYSHFALLIIGRFFDGIGSAGLMVTAPIFMFELLNHFHVRIAKPLIQILINLGILLICVFLIKETMDSIFQYSYLITSFLGILLAIVVFFLPESPVFVYSKYNDPEKTLEILQKLHHENASHYFEIIQSETNKRSTDENQSNFKQSELFTNKRFRLAIFGCILTNAAQQLSGINAVMAFAPTLLEKMKFSRPDLMSLIIISSGLIGSIVFAPIVTNFRRKLTLLSGFGTMSICMTVIIIIYNHAPTYTGAIIAFYVLFVFTFQIGPGPLVWFISTEVFPANVVPAAQGIGISINWISNAIIYSIPYTKIGNNILILFVIVNMSIVVYGYFFIAETYKRGTDEILADYEKRSKMLPCC